MTKEFILSEIKRTALDGKALGASRFSETTGIDKNDWQAFWARWGDAVNKAGFEKNVLVQPYAEDFLLSKYADYALELGKLPTSADMIFKAKNDKTFPSKSIFERRYSKSELISVLRTWCDKNEGYHEVINLCEEYTPKQSVNYIVTEKEESILGFVYLYKAGIYYKIGRTNDVGRRNSEIKLQLPFRAELIHSISTDDPIGIEQYWHKRFEDKRINGEWFSLTANDIKAFRKRKFQ